MSERGGIRGIFGEPYLDLGAHLDLGPLDAIHEEVCLAMASVPTDYTGGSHRSMGIMPPSREPEAIVDYVEVIRGLGDRDFDTLRSLSDEPRRFTRDAPRWGEEAEAPLSRRQMLWLEARFGVYFPWKAYIELIPNRYWEDKHDGAGKDFTRRAKAFFPKTIAYVESLPFSQIGRCNVMGLRANDHGTVHRDGDPKAPPDHFITLCPAGNKRVFLWDEERREKVSVGGRAYWFNDHDYHGVDADPFFRYSIRVDGVFRPDFLEALRRAVG